LDNARIKESCLAIEEMLQNLPAERAIFCPGSMRMAAVVDGQAAGNTPYRHLRRGFRWPVVFRAAP